MNEFLCNFRTSKMSFAVRSARLLSSGVLRHMQKRGFADEMAFTLAAANQVFYNGANVRQVDVPSFSGSFGILPKHVPTLGKLLRIDLERKIP